jgi:hypothetical protein
MLNLIIFVLILCSSLGVTISKITTEYGVKKHRQHIRPLQLDKDVLKNHS